MNDIVCDFYACFYGAKIISKRIKQQLRELSWKAHKFKLIRTHQRPEGKFNTVTLYSASKVCQKSVVCPKLTCEMKSNFLEQFSSIT